MITNSGSGTTGPCAAYHEYAAQVCAGTRVDDSFFGYVCALDDGDDPLTDEACWPKANPSLQFANLPGIQYLREQVTEARGMPAKEAIVRRLNFCQWTAAASPWLSAAVWDPCRLDYTADDLRGRRAYAALDLSSTTDLTGLVLLVEPQDDGEPWRMLPWCWLPEDGMRERCDRDRVDYASWVRSGYIETTPGRAISKRHVLQRLVQIFDGFEIVSLAYDRWRMADLIQLAAEEGADLPPMIDFGQGSGHGPGHRCFRGRGAQPHHCPQRPSADDVRGQRRGHVRPGWQPQAGQGQATGRIDLMVAAVMAAGVQAQQSPDTEKSWWETADA